MPSMDNKKVTIPSNKKVTIPPEFTGQHAPVTGANVLSFPDLKARNEKQKRLLTKVGIGIGGTVAALTFANMAKDAYREPGIVQEKQALESLKSAEAKTSGKVIVLNAGTQVRTTPVMPSADKGESPGNEAFKVKGGESMVINEAISNGDWIGFQKAEDEFRADKVGNNTYWVNVGQLNGQVSSDGKPYVESFSAGATGEALTATMHDDGRFYEVNTDNRVAVAQTVDAQNLNVVLEGLGVNN